LRVRPIYFCGGVGQWENWIIKIINCDGPGDGNPRSASSNDKLDPDIRTLSSNQVEGVDVYPNSATDLVNVISD